MNIKEVLDKAKTLRICVIGDYIVDRYIEGDVLRISPEAPVPIVRARSISENPGGAGNVVANLQGLGCRVDFFYNESNIPKKTRIMSNNHHMLRIDDEKDEKDIRWWTYSDIKSSIHVGIMTKQFDAIILSDYGKGTISREVAKSVIDAANRNQIPVIVDAKNDFEKFKGAMLIKCNEQEAKNFPPNTYKHPYHISRYRVTTKGANGMVVFGEVEYPIEGISIIMSDACGAGDTVTAVLAVMTVVQGNVLAAAKMANIAAASVCRFPGVHAIKDHELIDFYNEVYSHPSAPSIQPVSIQRDEAKNKNPHQENIATENGRGDAGDAQGEQCLNA